MGAKERSCGCGHEQSRHEGRTGACSHGCGCTAFHSKRWGARRTFISPAAGPVVIVDVTVQRAIAAIAKARAALQEAEDSLRSRPVAALEHTSLLSPPARREPRPAAGKAKGERAILIAVAQHPDGVTREMLTVLTGYKRSSRDTYLQRLRADGFVQDGDRLRVTPDGKRELGADYRPLPTGPALVEHWRERLPGGEGVIFDTVMRAGVITREALSNLTGYKRSSRDTYIQRLKSRELIRDSDADDGTLVPHDLLRRA